MNQFSIALLQLPFMQSVILANIANTAFVGYISLFSILPRDERSVAFGIKLWNNFWLEAAKGTVRATKDDIIAIQAIIDVYGLTDYLKLPSR
jgi:hypothetical protein